MITSVEANIDLVIDDRPVAVVSSNGLSLIVNFHTVRDALFVYRHYKKSLSLTGVEFLLQHAAKRETLSLFFLVKNQEIGSIQKGQTASALSRMIGAPNARFHLTRIVVLLLRSFVTADRSQTSS